MLGEHSATRKPPLEVEPTLGPPPEWTEVTLGDVISLEYGRSLPDKSRNPGSIPVYGSNGVVGWHDEALVPTGGIIVGRKGTAGCVTVSSGPFWPIDTTYFVKPRQTLDQEWLAATLQHVRLNDLNEATGVPGLNREKAYLQPILLPPLNEQRRMAEVLRSVDEAIAAAAQVATQARRLLADLAREIMQSPDQEATPGSEKLSLMDICRPKQHPIIGKADLTPTGYPVYGANGQIGYAQSYTHAEPVVAITCRGATCGTVNWVPEKSYVTGNAMALDQLDRQRVHERFLFHYISAWGVARSISGSAQPQITRQSLSCINIIAPAVGNQREIADALDAIETQATAAANAVAYARTVKAALVSDLLSGRVRFSA